MSELNPRKLVLSLQSLPTLSSELAQILRVANNPSAGAGDLEMLIMRSPPLTGRVLRVANSPLYGFRRRLGSIRDACVALGTRKVRNLATALSLAPTFKVDSGDLVEGSRQWSHALAVASWTQEIAPRMGVYELNELFTAGLMHDIGVTVLCQLATQRYHAVLQQAHDEEVSFAELEQYMLGTTHGKVGATLCAKWMLPAELTLLISHHHDAECPAEPHAQILKLADWLANQVGLSNFGWSKPEPLLPGLLDAAGLSESDLAQLLELTPQVLDVVGCFE